MDTDASPASVPVDNHWWLHVLESFLDNQPHSTIEQHTMQDRFNGHTPAVPGATSDSDSLPVAHGEDFRGPALTHPTMNRFRTNGQNLATLSHFSWRSQTQSGHNDLHHDPWGDTLHTGYELSRQEAIQNKEKVTSAVETHEHAHYHAADKLRSVANGIGLPYFESLHNPGSVSVYQAPEHALDTTSAPSPSYMDPLHALLNNQYLPFPVIAAADTGHASNHDQSWDELVSNMAQSSQAATEPKKLFRKSIPSSKFLKHHVQFDEVSAEDKVKTLPLAIAELIPGYKDLQEVINNIFFKDKLTWMKQGKELFSYTHKDASVSRFVSRMNTRRSAFQSKDTIYSRSPPFRGRVVIVPHRYSAHGNTVFDSDAGVRDLRFSFWVPSQDLLTQRLQFVGSAALTAADATRVLEEGQMLQGTYNSFNSVPDELFLPVAPPRRNTESTSHNVPVGTYSTSREWLRELPLLDRVDPAYSNRDTHSVSLVPRLHGNVDHVKESANLWLFGQNVEWQSRPTQLMFGTGPSRQVEVFRHHRRSSELFVTKPELNHLIPYQMVLIPYEVRDNRARRFDPALKGHAHTFTLWAARSTPHGEEAHKFDFVTGGALSVTKTRDVLERAQSILSQLSQTALHQT